MKHTTPLKDLYHDNSEAVLLLNLGTPNKANYFSVFRFLSEFLSDRRVIPLNPFVWRPLLHLVILPLRCWAVSKKYALIWGEEKSPLLEYMESIVTKLSQVDKNKTVYLAMRYGTPSLKSAVADIIAKKHNKLTILPLFPQYSDTTSGTALFATMHELSQYKHAPSFKFIHDFCNHPSYISAISQSIKDHWQKHGKADCLVMSFHGLPADSFEKGDPYSLCCMQTASLVAKKLHIADDRVKVVFQSRFGPKKWLQPYAEETIMELGQHVNTIDMIAPSFYCDCLETLEEIKEGLAESFQIAGGKELRYIPCLNDSKSSIHFLSDILELRSSHEATNHKTIINDGSQSENIDEPVT